MTTGFMVGWDYSPWPRVNNWIVTFTKPNGSIRSW